MKLESNSSCASRLGGVLVAFLLGSVAAHAQTDPLSEEWRWVYFDIESGIPTYQVSDLAVASDGTPFVRTSTGLAWFDGFGWEPIEHTRGVPTGGIDMRPDHSGRVLVIGGEHLFRAGRESFEHLDFGLPVQDAVATRRDELLLITSEAAYLGVDGGLAPVEPPPGLDGTTELGATGQGSVWATTTQGTWLWTGAGWSKLLPLRVIELFEDEQGVFLAIDAEQVTSGIWTWASGQRPERLEDGVPGLIRAASMHPDGSVVVCYESGSVRTRRAGRWEWMDVAPASLVQPDFLHFEDNGDLWVGAHDGVALFRGSLQRWERWSFGTGSQAVQVDALLLTRAGTTWVGTSSGIWIRHADGRQEHISSILGQPLKIVTGLAEDRSGAIWVSSGAGFSGAYRFQDGVWEHVGAGQGLTAQRVHDIVPDRRGRLWFLGISDRYGENEPGAFVLEDGQFERWGPHEGLPSGRVYSFDEGPDGAYWFGTRAGLSRYLDGRWTHWGEGDGVRAGLAFTVAVGDDGHVWFGHWAHGLGLGELDERGNLRYHTTDDGLAHNHVTELAFGPDGALYISTRRGLSRYQGGRFASLGRADGLGQPSIWRVVPTEERVYLGTVSGDVYVLSLAETRNPAPRVVVRAPHIDAGVGDFGWRATAFGGELPPERVETRYRLDDEAWSPWSRTRKATIEDLPAGPHTFQVQAKGLFGNIADSTAAATFQVEPPLYGRGWFAAVVGLWIVSMGGLGVAYWRRRREHHSLLRASEEHYRTLVDEIPICIHEIDLEGRLRSVNPAGLKMMGVEGFFAVDGIHYLEGVSASDRARVRSLFERALAGTASEFEFEFALEGSDSPALTFASTFVPVLASDGSVVKILGHTQDVTDRKLAEEQRRQLERRVRLAQKMEAIGLLAGGVAHDFNNLLTVISGHASLIGMDESASQRIQNSVSEILKAQERAGTLARQLLAFGRRQVLEPRTFDLNDILAKSEEMFGGLVEAGIELECRPWHEPVVIEADPGQIERVVMNLVLNARDAMPEGGKLSLSTRPAGLQMPSEIGDGQLTTGDYVALRVTDTGAGIEPETQARIFEPFFSTKAPDKGSGLGLAMVYGTVQQSGGHVEVQSRPGEGAAFTIYLPRVVAEAALDEPSPSVAGEGRGDETILVVDDEDGVREIVSSVLRRHGYNVLAASDGFEALEVIDVETEPVDLLLTDLAMPRMNGRELGRRFREIFPAGRIVYMSGDGAEILAADEKRDGGRGSEPIDLLCKPFLPSAVAERVRLALDGSQPAPGRGASAASGLRWRGIH